MAQGLDIQGCFSQILRYCLTGGKVQCQIPSPPSSLIYLTTMQSQRPGDCGDQNPRGLFQNTFYACCTLGSQLGVQWSLSCESLPQASPFTLLRLGFLIHRVGMLPLGRRLGVWEVEGRREDSPSYSAATRDSEDIVERISKSNE